MNPFDGGTEGMLQDSIDILAASVRLQRQIIEAKEEIIKMQQKSIETKDALIEDLLDHINGKVGGI